MRDRDGDGIDDDCDRCPNDREVFNGILDEDGCPDSSGTSHSVMLHPANRFGGVIRALQFDPGTATLSPEQQERAQQAVFQLEGAEAITCIGQAAQGEADVDTLAAARAVVLCQLLAARGFASDALSTHAVGSGPYLASSGDEAPTPGAAILVTRADGLQLWKRRGRMFERAMPPPRLEIDPPLSRACLDKLQQR